jgi:hypothetical protein
MVLYEVSRSFYKEKQQEQVELSIIVSIMFTKTDIDFLTNC